MGMGMGTPIDVIPLCLVPYQPYHHTKKKETKKNTKIDNNKLRTIIAATDADSKISTFTKHHQK